MMSVGNKYGAGVFCMRVGSNSVGEEDGGGRCFQNSGTCLANMVSTIENHNLRVPQINVMFVVCLVLAHEVVVDFLPVPYL